MADQQLKVINTEAINASKNLMGDRFSLIIKYFLEDTQGYIQEIEQGIQEKKLQGIVAAAHTIKSSAKQLGADRISDVARQIEALGREISTPQDQDYEKIKQLYGELKKELTAAIPEINKFC